MNVRDLMTTEVLTVSPETPLKDAAALLAGHGISGLPVCDEDGCVLGIVSEGDILFKERGPREPSTSQDSAPPLGSRFQEVAKESARTAGEAMTAPAVTIAPERPAAAAARMMLDHGVHRLPVVRDGVLLGIVTRADLVRAFTRTDAEIERELREDVLARTMWVAPGRVELEVRNGVVTLTGRLHTRTDAELLDRLAGRVPGVLSVDSGVRWEIDDTTRKGRRAIEQPVR